MLPAVFVPVAHLPLTRSGKIDRRALPEPAKRGRRGGTHAVPQSHLERVYRDLLRVARIGLHDNFFDLGGHSLLIVRGTEAQAHAGPGDPVLDLFRFPTVAALARYQ